MTQGLTDRRPWDQQKGVNPSGFMGTKVLTGIDTKAGQSAQGFSYSVQGRLVGYGSTAAGSGPVISGSRR